MKPKPLYTSYTAGNLISTIASKAICIAVLIYLLLHVQENPLVIGICSTLVLLLILTSGKQYIVIYASHFEIKSTALVTKNIVYAYTDLTAISGEPPPARSEVIGYLLLKNLTNPGSVNTRKLYVTLKDGMEKMHVVDNSQYELDRVVGMIRERLGNNS